MLTEAQIKQVEHSYKHGDTFVFKIEGRGVFISDKYSKNKEEKTITFKECYEVDESDFSGSEYYGDFHGPKRTFVLEDPFGGHPNIYASRYKEKEIKEEK